MIMIFFLSLRCVIFRIMIKVIFFYNMVLVLGMNMIEDNILVK